MLTDKPKIELYQQRSFGQKFSATFDFLRENIKLWLRASLYTILPICLLQALALEHIGNFFTNITAGMAGANGLTSIISSYMAYVVCIVIGTSMMTSVCYSLMKHYQSSPTGLQGVTLKALRPLIIRNFKRTLKLTFAIGGLFILATIALTLFGAIINGVLNNALGVVLLIIGIMVLLVSLSLSMPVYIFEEDTTAFGAIKRGFRLGWPAFLPTLGLIIVIGLLTGILQATTSVPWYLLYMGKAALTISNDAPEVASSPFYNFALYLTAVLQSFGAYLSMALTLIALAYQYGSIAEAKNSLSVEDDIAHFEQLSEEDKEIDNFDKL